LPVQPGLDVPVSQTAIWQVEFPLETMRELLNPKAQAPCLLGIMSSN